MTSDNLIFELVNKIHGPPQVICVVFVIPLNKSIQIEKAFSFAGNDPQLATHKPPFEEPR